MCCRSTWIAANSDGEEPVFHIIWEHDERPFKVRLPQKEGCEPGANLALFVDPADLVLLTG